MSVHTVSLDRKQTREILKIVSPYLKERNDWEELEVYILRGSKFGSVYIYTREVD